MNTQQPRQFKILLIGDDCVDVYQFGTVDRISPEAPVPVFECTHEERKPGMAGNVLKLTNARMRSSLLAL
jgi:D-beta-D-heptose 7-phosphate kinase/D-beta-D-heptose 1-phosphate adenosyltransferase